MPPLHKSRKCDRPNQKKIFFFPESDDDDGASYISSPYLFLHKTKRTPACGPLLKLLAVLARSAVTN